MINVKNVTVFWVSDASSGFMVGNVWLSDQRTHISPILTLCPVQICTDCITMFIHMTLRFKILAFYFYAKKSWWLYCSETLYTNPFVSQDKLIILKYEEVERMTLFLSARTTNTLFLFFLHTISDVNFKLLYSNLKIVLDHSAESSELLGGLFQAFQENTCWNPKTSQHHLC